MMSKEVGLYFNDTVRTSFWLSDAGCTVLAPTVERPMRLRRPRSSWATSGGRCGTHGSSGPTQAQARLGRYWDRCSRVSEPPARKCSNRNYQRLDRPKWVPDYRRCRKHGWECEIAYYPVWRHTIRAGSQ